MPRIRTTVRFSLPVLLAVSLLGCGQADPPPKLSPVTGKVVFRKQPVALATITFVPDLSQGGLRGRDGRATTDRNGCFTLETYPSGSGAMAGHYKVTVMYYSRTEYIPRKYTKFHLTPLRAIVKEEGENDLLLVLQD
jgi:hypothetical protein